MFNMKRRSRNCNPTRNPRDTLPDQGIAAGRSLRPSEPESCAVLCQGDFAARTKRWCCAKSRASYVGNLNSSSCPWAVHRAVNTKSAAPKNIWGGFPLY